MSRTRTTTTTRRMAKSRAYDHVYDPVYTVSSQAEHIKLHQQATLAGVETISNFENIFSVLPHHSAHEFRVRGAALQVSPFPPAGEAVQPASALPPASRDRVIGRDRTKFFTRPDVAVMAEVPAEAILAGASSAATAAAAEVAAEEDDAMLAQLAQDVSSAHRTVGVQTAYRDGAAQTDPYTPDFVIPAGAPEDPELLQIEHMTFQDGLPGGMTEVKMVQRMREKRRAAAALPQGTDPESFAKQKKMLEEQELEEWKLREEEMEREQEERLALLVNSLRKREEKRQDYLEKRVARLRERLQKTRDNKMQSIQRQRVKLLRNLGKQRQAHVEPVSRKRDVVDEYANYGSRVYAPAARDGAVPVKNEVVDYGIPLIKTYQGLSALEETAAPQVFRGQPAAMGTQTAPLGGTGTAVTSVGAAAAASAAKQDQATEPSAVPEATEAEPIENVYRAGEVLIRPPTPDIDDDDASRVAQQALVHQPNKQRQDAAAEAREAARQANALAERQYCATLLLQRLLRGRAVQNIMCEGKDACRDLIDELRVDEDAVGGGGGEPERSTRIMLDSQPLEDDPAVSQRVRELSDAVQGHVVSEALDYLSKEAVHASEESRLSRLSKRAESVRRVREAEESGRRQAEVLMRAKQAEHTAAVLETHQATVDVYLDRVFEDAIERVAAAQAHEEAQGNRVVEDDDDTGAADGSDRLVVDKLITGYMFPEVERRHQRIRDQIASNRSVNAAHGAVIDAAAQAAGVERDDEEQAAQEEEADEPAE